MLGSITNQSGLKLSYWVESAAGDAHLLRPFQSSDLLVEPVEKSVIMPDSQQHITARTICMQFEGNWSPVPDIIVDKVGKYAYTIGSHHDSSVTPVVMDVSLDIRTKVRPPKKSLSPPHVPYTYLSLRYMEILLCFAMLSTPGIYSKPSCSATGLKLHSGGMNEAK